jgi:hypothetical protein
MNIYCIFFQSIYVNRQERVRLFIQLYSIFLNIFMAQPEDDLIRVETLSWIDKLIVLFN